MFFSSKFNPVTDIPALEGKVVIVTGAKYVFKPAPFPFTSQRIYSSAGIGFPTAQQLANHGALVYLAVRDIGKGEAAIQQIEKENPSLIGKNSLKVLQLDLNNAKATKEAALRFLEQEDRLDLLSKSYRSKGNCANI